MSMTRNNNHDDDDDDDASSSSSSKKRLKAFDNGDVAPWSDANHDVLFLLMMQLGFIDFIAFSRVCKSWRSLPLSNGNMFMMSKLPPMKIYLLSHASKGHSYCYLEEDCERKWFMPIIPHSFCSMWFGLTCGYVILFSRKTRDIWLVNPITRHELHFPDYPSYVIRAILVFSPSISEWVFVIINNKISFCIAGKRGWNHVSSTIPIIDLHVFKGKIYTLHTDCSLGELRLDLKSKRKGEWTFLETKSLLELNLCFARLVSSNDSLFLINLACRPIKVMELYFGEMKWVSREKTIEEYAFFISYNNFDVGIKPKSWAGSWTQQHKSQGHILDTGKIRQVVLSYEGPWYFPYDCLNANLLDE